MSATKSRAKQRTDAAKAVADIWDNWNDDTRPDTSDPEFWVKYADHDEALKDAYRALNRLTDDRALAMALQDAEEFRRVRAKNFRRNAEQAQQAEASVRGVSTSYASTEGAQVGPVQTTVHADTSVPGGAR